MAREYDQPVAALLQDLEARGLLKDTLVMGVTEFGRTPVAQGAGKKGRDHHPDCSPVGWRAPACARDSRMAPQTASATSPPGIQ